MARYDTDTALEEQITENLRRAFRQRAEEKVPDRFTDLLRQLRAQDEGGQDAAAPAADRNGGVNDR